jgi:hypothetical protein
MNTCTPTGEICEKKKKKKKKKKMMKKGREGISAWRLPFQFMPACLAFVRACRFLDRIVT